MLSTYTLFINNRFIRGGGCVVVAAVTLLAAAAPAPAATFSWTAIDGTWSTAGNWNPAGPPDLGDVARLGNLPGVENGDVFLDQNDAVAELHITDGMTLSNQDHTFSVIGDTFLSGLNEVPIGGGGTAFNHSRIFIRPTPAPVQFSTDGLELTDEARVRLHEGGVVEVRGQMSLDSGSSVFGEGGIRFIDTGTVLANSGVIDPFGGQIVFNVTNGGALDLDGFGSGRVQLQWGGERLTINGGTLADPFSGEMLIDADARLDMNLDAPWEADQFSQLTLGWANNGIQPEPAVVTGAEVTLAGDLSVSSGHTGRFDAPTEFAATAETTVGTNATLRTTAPATVDGGTFSLGQGANLLLDGPVDFQGGEFSTHSQLSSGGAVRVNGPTTWRGDVTINGVALQNGDATVSGETTIDAGVFDMDGGGGTQWSIVSGLIVDADSIDSTISNTFDGSISVGGGITSRLVINLTGSFDHWTMNGDMTLTNPLPFQTSRLGGSPMRMTGSLTIDGPVRSNADITFGANGATGFADPASSLRVTGLTVVEAGASFAGGGELINLAIGSLLLEDGANTAGSTIRNSGEFEVGEGAAGAVVDAIHFQDPSLWHIEIGGHAPIAEHDSLFVAGGPAEVGGAIEVSLIDAGNGLFLPVVGDEFTVLTSLDPVSGAFLGSPVSFAAGQQFHWDIVHEPNAVTLVLADITNVVPEPASAVLLLMAAAAVSPRTAVRRRGIPEGA